jgi:hypothetical protein
MGRMLGPPNRYRSPAIIAGCAAIVLVADPRVRAAVPKKTCPTSVKQCPLQGCSTSPSAFAPFDQPLNMKKNRAAGVAQATTTTYTVAQVLDQTRFPVHHPMTTNGTDVRSTWKNTTAMTKITALEATQISVQAYVARATQESAESCNCEIKDAQWVDTHINLIDRPADGSADPKTLVGKSMIVEVTWRVRTDGKGQQSAWTPANLERLAITHDGAFVRITGDLMYDNLHWTMVNKGQRGTLWEIHPIRRIQVRENGAWRDYDPSAVALAAGAVRSMASPMNGAAPMNAPASSSLTGQWQPHWTAAQVKALDASLGQGDHS